MYESFVKKMNSKHSPYEIHVLVEVLLNEKMSFHAWYPPYASFASSVVS